MAGELNNKKQSQENKTGLIQAENLERLQEDILVFIREIGRAMKIEDRQKLGARLSVLFRNLKEQNNPLGITLPSEHELDILLGDVADPDIARVIKIKFAKYSRTATEETVMREKVEPATKGNTEEPVPKPEDAPTDEIMEPNFFAKFKNLDELLAVISGGKLNKIGEYNTSDIAPVIENLILSSRNTTDHRVIFDTIIPSIKLPRAGGLREQTIKLIASDYVERTKPDDLTELLHEVASGNRETPLLQAREANILIGILTKINRGENVMDDVIRQVRDPIGISNKILKLAEEGGVLKNKSEMINELRSKEIKQFTPEEIRQKIAEAQNLNDLWKFLNELTKETADSHSAWLKYVFTVTSLIRSLEYLANGENDKIILIAFDNVELPPDEYGLKQKIFDLVPKEYRSLLLRGVTENNKRTGGIISRIGKFFGRK